MRKHRLLPLLLALPACSDTYTPEPDPGYGELGVGVFLLECPTLSDPACVGGGSVATSFPRAFAVGGRFGLQYDWKSSDDEHYGDPLPQIQTSAPQLLDRAGDGFTVKAPGYAAVLAVTGDSEIVDIRHLYLAEVDALQIVALAEPLATPLITLALEPGETVELLVRPIDGDDQPLSGRLEYTWASSDVAVASITAGGGDTGRLTISAGLEGESTLSVTLGDLAAQITISVASEPDLTTGEATLDTTGDTDATGSSDDSGSTGDGSGSSGSTGGAL
jgi:hypothetical protein